MSSFIQQSSTMIRANVLSVPRRASTSLSMVISIMLVVCVLAGFLAMAKGFEVALLGAGSQSVAIVLGGGTNQETSSEITPEIVRTIEALSGDIGVVRDSTGNLDLSREIVVSVVAKPHNASMEGALSLRGMDPSGPAIRNNVTLSEGRLFTRGAHEIIVGDQIAKRFGFHVGDKVRLGPVEWTIVGRFQANGSAFESEVWADLDAVRSAFNRQGEVQSLRMRLSNPQSLATLQSKLASIATTPLFVVSEANLYAEQSGRTANLIRLFGWPLALLMAFGASAGAVNTMMNSVSDRATEIATVRALGFSRLSAFIGTWVESILLAAVGVCLGLAASWLTFNGWQASTMGANRTQTAFQLTVSLDVMFEAGLLGLAIGVIGGALPAAAATRLPLTLALRSNG